jgi:hypothetical protein
MNKFHNDLQEDEEFALFVQISSGKFPVVCAIITKTSIQHVRVPPEQAKEIIKGSKARYVVLDGVQDKIAFSSDLQLFCMLVKESNAECQVVIVRSMAAGDSVEVCASNDVEPFEVYPWSLQQYLAAYADTDFQKSVKDYLDIGSGSSDMNPIHKKYYYAGSSARWMFAMTLDQVQRAVLFYVDRIGNFSEFIRGASGINSAESRSHLLLRNKSVDGIAHEFIVSKYVTSLVLDRGAADVYNVCYRLASDQDNPSFMGWIVEFDFISQLKACAQLSPASMTLKQHGGCNVTWPVQRVVAFDPDNISEIPLNTWLKPIKWNQEGFDLACVVREEDEGETYLRYVQVTHGQAHKANILFLKNFASDVAKFLAITTGLGVEYVVVYPTRATPPTISIVPTPGHLSHFKVGKSSTLWTRGNEVDHIKFLSFDTRKQ